MALLAREVQLELAVGVAALIEGRERAPHGRVERLEGHHLGDAVGERAGLVRSEGQPQLEKHVLEAHHAEPDRAPAPVRGGGFRRGVEVAIDHPVQSGHHLAHGAAQRVEVERAVFDEGRQVDRAEVAHRRLGAVRHLQDLGAQVGRADQRSGLAGLRRSRVGRVLEAQPAVAGLGEGLEHPGVERAGRDLLDGLAVTLELLVVGLEVAAPGLEERGRRGGAKQAPEPVRLDALHEEVRHPQRQVQVVGAALLGAGVLAQVQKGLDVRVPGLKVDGRRALALAALVDGVHGAVEHLEEGHQPGAGAVVALDQGTRRAHGGPVDADAAGPLGEPGAVRVGLVDALERVLAHREQVAARHLRVAGAGVEERRGGRHVAEGGHQVVEPDGFVDRSRKTQRHAHEEPLGPLEDLAGVRPAQQVTVVEGLEAEVLEVAVARVVEGVHNRFPIGVRQGHQLVGNEPVGARLGQVVLEGAAEADFLGHQAREQTGGDPRVGRLFHGHHDRRGDRLLVELAGGGAVVEGADGDLGDRHGLHPAEARAGLGDGAQDLVELDTLAGAVAFGD
ncbi:hypothetical protein D3C72_801020 [compost metagenome]